MTGTAPQDVHNDDAGTIRLSWIGKADAPALDSLPALAETMALVAEAWTGIFASLAQATPFEIKLRGIESCRIEEAATRRGTGAVLAALDVPAWGSALGLAFDRAFMATVVEVLFGGDGLEEADTDFDPVVSPMMLQMTEVAAQQAADALAAGFAERAPAAIGFDRILAKPDFGFLGKPGSSVTAATFALQAWGRTTLCDIFIPQATMQTLAGQIAAADSMVATTPSDPAWSRQLEAEIGRTVMQLRAKIDVPALSLGAVASLLPGQILALPIGAGHRITLGCADEELFRCDLGQSDGFYTLRVRDALAPETGPHDGHRSFIHTAEP